MKKIIFLAAIFALATFQPVCAEEMSGKTRGDASASSVTESQPVERSFNEENEGESNSSVRNRTAPENRSVSTRGSATLDGDIGMPSMTVQGNATARSPVGVR